VDKKTSAIAAHGFDGAGSRSVRFHLWEVVTTKSCQHVDEIAKRGLVLPRSQPAIAESSAKDKNQNPRCPKPSAGAVGEQQTPVCASAKYPLLYCVPAEVFFRGE